MYGNHMMYHGMDDHHLQQPLADFGVDANGNAHSPMNGDAIQTPNQLLAVNSGLKTRVDELEVINDLIQRRLQHYETYGPSGNNEEGLVVAANLRAQVEALQQSEAQLRSQLEESHRRENAMKRRLDEMELELNALQTTQDPDNGRAKRPRLEEEPVINIEETEARQEIQEAPMETEAVAQAVPENVPEALPAAEAAPEAAPEAIPEALEDVPTEAALPEAQVEAPMMEAEALKEALA